MHPEITTVGNLLALLKRGGLSGIVQVGATSKNVAGRNWKAFRGLRQRAKGRLTADVLERWILQVVNAADSNVSYARVLSHDLREFSDALDEAVKPAANKPKRTRRPSKSRKSRPLTVWQTEVVQIVGECKGNIAEAARQLGKNRKTIEEAYRAGMGKLGKTIYRSKDKTRLLPRDKRGQEAVSEDEDLRRQ